MEDFPRLAAFGHLQGVSYWQRRLEDECARAGRHGQPFALLLIEVTGGDSQAGYPVPPAEGVLVLVAESLRRTIRGSDVLCRLTPTRFGVLVLQTNARGGQTVARRLHLASLRAVARSLPPNLLPCIAVGQAVFTPECSSPGALTATAEAALGQQHDVTAAVLSMVNGQ